MGNDGERWSCADWAAWYNDEPGPEPDPNLRVSARCRFSSGSIRWSLEPTNEGTVDDPERFVLRLTVDDPGTGTADFVEESIGWEGDAGPDIKVVEIRGDASLEIEVTRAS